jgi:hypothetical protein
MPHIQPIGTPKELCRRYGISAATLYIATLEGVGFEPLSVLKSAVSLPGGQISAVYETHKCASDIKGSAFDTTKGPVPVAG